MKIDAFPIPVVPAHCHFGMILRKQKASAELNGNLSNKGSCRRYFSMSQPAHQILPEINLYRWWWLVESEIKCIGVRCGNLLFKVWFAMVRPKVQLRHGIVRVIILLWQNHKDAESTDYYKPAIILVPFVGTKITYRTWQSKHNVNK